MSTRKRVIGAACGSCRKWVVVGGCGCGSGCVGVEMSFWISERFRREWKELERNRERGKAKKRNAPILVPRWEMTFKQSYGMIGAEEEEIILILS